MQEMQELQKYHDRFRKSSAKKINQAPIKIFFYRNNEASLKVISRWWKLYYSIFLIMLPKYSGKAQPITEYGEAENVSRVFRG